MKQLFKLNFFHGNEYILLNKILEKENISIFTPNIDHIIKLNKDNELYKKYSKSDFIIADGWPIAVTGKLKGLDINRITGVDIMDRLLQYADEEKKRIFFLGGEDKTLEMLKNNIRVKYPKINSIESYNGFFHDNEEVIMKINNNKTDILFVGMGCPKQEVWIIDNKEKLNCKIMIAIGGAFKIYSGEVSRAPKIVQKLGLEWFYRFLKEPKRLFKRYFVEYLQFIPILIKEFIL